MTVVSPNLTSVVGVPIQVAQAAKAAQNDTVLLSPPGVFFMQAYVQTGAAETINFNTVTLTATVTAAQTTLTYDGATANARNDSNFYVKLEDEIVYVKSDSGDDSTSGTLTVVHGVLGTTAAIHANDTDGYVLNSLKLAGATTGTVTIVYVDMPEFRHGLNFNKTAPSSLISTVNPNTVYGEGL